MTVSHGDCVPLLVSMQPSDAAKSNSQWLPGMRKKTLPSPAQLPIRPLSPSAGVQAALASAECVLARLTWTWMSSLDATFFSWGSHTMLMPSWPATASCTPKDLKSWRDLTAMSMLFEDQQSQHMFCFTNHKDGTAAGEVAVEIADWLQKLPLPRARQLNGLYEYTSKGGNITMITASAHLCCK